MTTTLAETPPPSRLELHEPGDAFRRLEAWLGERGFFTPRGASLVADVYLGYGLAQRIRRTVSPTPPEVCSLPLISCVVRQGNYPIAHDDNRSSFTIGRWERTWTEDEYGAAVQEVRGAIGRGDVYQVNLVQHLSAPFAGDPLAIAARLRTLTQPRDWPLAGDDWRVFAGDGWAIVSASPELFLARRGRRLLTMPIKGTRPLGEAAALRGSAKDAAEHVMIVDLERNDLSRVCEAGTIRWPELMRTEALAGVEHMVSTVEGRVRDDVTLAEILEATFPGGSVTGAPKIAAVDLIAALEPVGRGASMGALGRIHGNGDFELALTIRTLAVVSGTIHLWVGGGIVWDSDPAAEVAESLAKAKPVLAAIGAPLGESESSASSRLGMAAR